MKIIYVGQVDQGGTCFDRMQSIKRLGHEVFPFDTSIYESKYRLVRSMQWRLKPALLLAKLNQDLLEFVQNQKVVDLVWIDKGIWIFPETIHVLKKNATKVVHYTPDPQILFHKSKHFMSSIKIYDYLITTKSFELDLYRQHGAVNTILSHQSYCPIRYLNPIAKTLFKCDIGFIGHYEKHYGGCLSSVSKKVKDVKVWGSGWPRAAFFGSVPKNIVNGNGVWGEDYVHALASFKIGLGLLSKHIPEQHTTRTFEIPAAGTFLLAERTQEHMSFFEEGLEAEYFSTNDELADKSKFYLANDSARGKIAKAGQKRCLASGYDNDYVIRKIFKELSYEH